MVTFLNRHYKPMFTLCGCSVIMSSPLGGEPGGMAERTIGSIPKVQQRVVVMTSPRVHLRGLRGCL